MYKIKLTTTYSNVDKEFLDWWLKNNGENYGINIEGEAFPSITRLEDRDPVFGRVLGRTVIEIAEDKP